MHIYLKCFISCMLIQISGVASAQAKVLSSGTISNQSSGDWYCLVNKIDPNKMIVPNRYKDSMIYATGSNSYLTAASPLPIQKWVDYTGPYDSARDMALASASSPLPGLVDGCGLSNVPLDFGGVVAYVNSRLKNVPSPYGGYGVYAPFDVRFRKYRYQNIDEPEVRGVSVMMGGIYSEEFSTKTPSNPRYPDRLYSSLGNGRYVKASDFGTSCSLTIYDERGTKMNASCRYDWAQDYWQQPNASTAYSAQLFLDSVITADGVKVQYNYVPTQDYLDSIVTSSVTGASVSAINFSYFGRHRDARLGSVTFTDSITGTQKVTNLTYSNGSVTGISSDFGAVEFSYDDSGRLRSFYTKSAALTYPPGGIVFDYNARDQVTQVTGPVQIKTASGSAPLSLTLSYVTNSHWRSTSPENMIIVTNNLTGKRSFVTSWWQGDVLSTPVQIDSVSNKDALTMPNGSRTIPLWRGPQYPSDFCESMDRHYCITRGDDSGAGSYVDFKFVRWNGNAAEYDYFGIVAPVEAGDRNENKRSWFFTDRVDDIDTPFHKIYKAYEGIQTPSAGRRDLLVVKPVMSADRKYYMDEFYSYYPLTKRGNISYYDDTTGVQRCSFDFNSSGDDGALHCNDMAPGPYSTDNKTVCRSVANGRCASYSYFQGGITPDGKSFPAYNTTITADSTYPWLDAVIESPAGKVTIERAGNRSTETVSQGGKLISQTMSDFNFYGLTNINSRPFGDGVGYQSSFSYYNNGALKSAANSSGDTMAFGVDSVLGMNNSVVMSPQTNQGLKFSVASTLNSLGVPYSVTASAGESSTSSASVNIQAYDPNITPAAPARPADLCDPTSATGAGICNGNRAFICGPNPVWKSADDVNYPMLQWTYGQISGCGNNNTSCTTNYKVKGVPVPWGVTAGDAPQRFDMNYPVCIYSANSAGSCCTYSGCSYSSKISVGIGQNRYGGKYRCEYIPGFNLPSPSCALTAGDFCAEPPPVSHLPAGCSKWCY